MTTRAALLGSAAVAGAAAWTVTASAGMLALSGLWSHPHFAHGPAWSWSWLSYALDPAARAAIGPALTWSAAGAAGVVGAAAARLWHVWGRKVQPLHGTARWVRRREAQKRRDEVSGLVFSRKPPADGLVLGKQWSFRGPEYVSLLGEEHAALTARTRSGKGVSFVVPNALGWSGSLVCFSVKRDVWDAAAAERARRGDAVFIFDLSDPQRRTHRWNPLGYVRRGDPATYGDIQRAMWFLVPETKANNPFWDNAARKIATAVGVILAETPGARLTVSAVLEVIRRPDYDEALRAMIDAARREGRPYPAAAVETVTSWLARKGENGPEDVRETLNTALALWNDPVVEAATEAADFDLAALRSRRMSVFICGGPADLRLFRPVYGLLFQQLVQLNTRVEFGRDPTHQHRVLGLLDEFWALGKQDVLADAAAFTASYGFRWAYVQQTKAQSVTAFGEPGAENLFNNTGAEIVFGGTDRKTAQEVSDRMGFNTVEEVTKNRPRFMGWAFPSKQSETENLRRRALMLPQEISGMSKNLAIVLRPGMPPLRLRRLKWFRDPAYRLLGGEPPPVPTLRVVVRRDAIPAAPPAEQVQAEQEQAAWETAEEAAALARELRETAADAAETARTAAAEAAAAGEQARMARAEATETARAARAAALDLEEAHALGVVPPKLQRAAETTQQRADVATDRARALTAEAAAATERARAAKLAANAADRKARSAETRATHLAGAAAAVADAA